MDLELLCLQKHPEFIDECIELLNDQWPRSKTARLVSIQQGSSEGFPTTLILIDKSSHGKERVVAQCKVSPVSAQYPNACFIESVVVARDLRGKGVGRTIMEKAEEYVRSKGIVTVYLTTHDQQRFYSKLGYSLCEPVVIYGGKFSKQTRIKDTDDGLKRSHAISRLDDKSPTTQESLDFSSGLLESIALQDKNATSTSPTKITPPNNSKSTLPPPPPPAPPMPSLRISQTQPISKEDIILIRSNDYKVTMKKEL